MHSNMNVKRVLVVMPLAVLVFIIPLHFAFVLVVVFVPGSVFFVFSVSYSWFCTLPRKLYILYRALVLFLCCGP